MYSSSPTLSPSLSFDWLHSGKQEASQYMKTKGGGRIVRAYAHVKSLSIRLQPRSTTCAVYTYICTVHGTSEWSEGKAAYSTCSCPTNSKQINFRADIQQAVSVRIALKRV